jgi:hypothetical protein
MSKAHFRLEAGFAESGWIRMMTFDGRGAFLPKRTTGATGASYSASIYCSIGPKAFPKDMSLPH